MIFSRIKMKLQVWAHLRQATKSKLRTTTRPLVGIICYGILPSGKFRVRLAKILRGEFRNNFHIVLAMMKLNTCNFNLLLLTGRVPVSDGREEIIEGRHAYPWRRCFHLLGIRGRNVRPRRLTERSSFEDASSAVLRLETVNILSISTGGNSDPAPAESA
jgi:hypothetical protein